MKIKEMLKITGGRLLSGTVGSDINLSRVSTDSRTIKRGEFFIALGGPNFRGSDFTDEAFSKGARGAIVERRAVSAKYKNRILIEVKDTTKALQDIAASHRAKFKIPVICVTGSNGKTTVKEMIASVLSSRYDILKSQGTMNNQIGVPMTLLKLKSEHELCVLELGTNQKGEIRALAAIARPTVAVITNIGPSHLEFLIDLDGVCREKMQLVGSLPRGSTVIVNGDDRFLGRISARRCKVLRYGLKKSNDFVASDIHSDGGVVKFMVNDAIDCSLRLLGAHNVYNALAAIAVASLFKMDARAASKELSLFKPSNMRLNTLDVNGISFINDAYNSNPASMKAALEAVEAFRARAKWVVSGDMLELGKGSARFHEMTGRLVAASGANGLIALGKFSGQTLSGASACGMRDDRLWRCGNHDEIAGIIRKVARAGDVVLIKGSRGMRMEQVIEKLKRH